jgi:competence ComEA-like helix-hairpin-helix protein
MSVAGRYQSAVAITALVFLAGGIFVYMMLVIGASTESDANLRIVEDRISSASSFASATGGFSGGHSSSSPGEAQSGFKAPQPSAGGKSDIGFDSGAQSKPPSSGGSEYKKKPLPKDKINVNTANAEKLAELPGIGPVLAERIVQYRNENGFFNSPEDLMNVKGIAEKKLAAMLPYVKVE